MNRTIVSTLLAGLLLVMAGACGAQGLGQMLVDAGSALMDAGTAHAQSACTHWEVQRIIYDNVVSVVNSDTQTAHFAGSSIALPAGWEPFGGTAYGGSTPGRASQYLLLRRCVP